MPKYRIWGRTETSIAAPVYEGKIDVFADTIEEAEEEAQRRCRAAHSGRGMKIERVECLGSGRY